MIEDTGDGKEMTRAMADVPASGIDKKINKRWVAGRGHIANIFNDLFSQDWGKLVPLWYQWLCLD